MTQGCDVALQVDVEAQFTRHPDRCWGKARPDWGKEPGMAEGLVFKGQEGP